MVPELIKRLFERYNKEEISSTEISYYLQEKGLIQEISGADAIMKHLALVSTRNFQKLESTCRLCFLQALSAYNELDNQLSFTQYIDKCLQTKRTKQKFDNLSFEDREMFWITVGELQSRLYTDSI